MAEFAHKGYKNASTNEIVKNANISKGLLFHYFNNKKGLFMFLYNYSKDIFLNEFYSKYKFESTDIINALRQAAVMKIDLIQRHLELYDFLISAAADDSEEVKWEFENTKNDVLADFYKKFFENMDTSLFKDDLDIKYALDIIAWFMEGFANRELAKLRSLSGLTADYDLNMAIVDFDKYIELLKGAFYK
jgi:AcrR family transcriptional regulator